MQKKTATSPDDQLKQLALKTLKNVFGFSHFRTLQEDIVLSVGAGNDTVALLPTGGGKSLCFQVPAMMQDGICLVVSPLIALMKDQVDALRKKGILAAAVYSGMGKREIDTTLDNCIYGNYKFLYVSPERLKTPIFIARFKKMKVSLIAVDEAHCISQWGYDFRRPYLDIAEIRPIHPDVPVIALTASATLPVRDDIINKLDLARPNVFVGSFARPNLSYSVRFVENKVEMAIKILEKVPGSSIVYSRSRKGTRNIAQVLNKLGVSAHFYHAGLDNAAREKRQQDWMVGKVRVMVATNAFGMGIDKPDVRSVIHMELPENLEYYYQEAGRAGRDGIRAYGVVLTHQNDLNTIAERAEMAYPPLDYIKKVYQCLANYYRIAVGSSLMSSYDIELGDFTGTYQLEMRPAYQALKVMQEEGLIALSESFNTQSTIHLTIDQSKLYEFQIAYEKLDSLIKILLRMYGGELFVAHIPIQESVLANTLGVPIVAVEKGLKFLDQQGVAAYEERKSKPQITFLTPRYDAPKLPLNINRIAERRANSLEKAKSVIAYARNDRVCRTIQLVSYFGEDNEQQCGECDVCMKEKRLMKRAKLEKQFREKIIKTLEGGLSFPLEGLLSKTGVRNDSFYVSLLREWEDEGLIKMTSEGKIKLT